ncbi:MULTISPECIES: hypothetical protein [Falsihalocynthiibacter]|uniref:hypothetical protein n=1 Tax=Falsihalocynthiibacter TaxID=2854182 RepID=UPI003003777A
MSVFAIAAQLKKMLLGMEKDLGFDTLSESEKSILYAVIDLEGGSAIHSSLIKSHELTDSLTKPTFHRALKSLVSKGYIIHEDGTKTGLYRFKKANFKTS